MSIVVSNPHLRNALENNFTSDVIQLLVSTAVSAVHVLKMPENEVTFDVFHWLVSSVVSAWHRANTLSNSSGEFAYIAIPVIL